MASLRRSSLLVSSARLHGFARSSVAGATAGIILLAASVHPAAAQVLDGVGLRSSASAFMTVGGENTQLPAYADNALGFDLGVTVQSHPFAGGEFRVGAYPFSARYVQMPITGGYRVAARSLFGFPYAPFAYFGGGVSRSQDKGTTRKEYPPHWDPCWQANVGFDRVFGSFTWRAAEFSWRETYTPLHSLRTIGLSTGLVYRFARGLH